MGDLLYDAVEGPLRGPEPMPDDWHARNEIGKASWRSVRAAAPVEVCPDAE